MHKIKATIKEDAPAIFWKDNVVKVYPPSAIPPKTYSDFYDLLKKLKGKTFEIDREYDDRIVLKYPKKMIKENVVGIDLEKKLVIEK